MKRVSRIESIRLGDTTLSSFPRSSVGMHICGRVDEAEKTGCIPVRGSVRARMACWICISSAKAAYGPVYIPTAGRGNEKNMRGTNYESRYSCANLLCHRDLGILVEGHL